MKPTIINVLITADLEMPVHDWAAKKRAILRKVMRALPTEHIRLLTFDTEDRIAGYRETEKNTVLLEISISNFARETMTAEKKPLGEKLKELMESNTVTIQNYFTYERPESETSETRICLNIQAA
jgi:hypothetical protein